MEAKKFLHLIAPPLIVPALLSQLLGIINLNSNVCIQQKVELKITVIEFQLKANVRKSPNEHLFTVSLGEHH